MKMQLYPYVMNRLARWRGRWPEVAIGSGVSKRTLEKIARGEVRNPTVATVQQLATWFEKQDRPRL